MDKNTENQEIITFHLRLFLNVETDICSLLFSNNQTDDPKTEVKKSRSMVLLWQHSSKENLRALEWIPWKQACKRKKKKKTTHHFLSYSERTVLLKMKFSQQACRWNNLCQKLFCFVEFPIAVLIHVKTRSYSRSLTELYWYISASWGNYTNPVFTANYLALQMQQILVRIIMDLITGILWELKFSNYLYYIIY